MHRNNKALIAIVFMQLWECLITSWQDLISADLVEFKGMDGGVDPLSLPIFSSGPGLKDLWSSALNSPLSSQRPR